MILDLESIISPSLSLLEGGIVPLASQFETRTWFAKLILEVMNSVGFPGNLPIGQMTDAQKQVLYEGLGEKTFSIGHRHGKGCT
jgi:hypothetical protein